jgi:hypothetical protein
MSAGSGHCDSHAYLAAEFPYSLMPVDLAHIVDPSMAESNAGRLSLMRRVEVAQESDSESRVSERYRADTVALFSPGAGPLTRPEVLQLINMAINFAQFLAEL